MLLKHCAGLIPNWFGHKKCTVDLSLKARALQHKGAHKKTHNLTHAHTLSSFIHILKHCTFLILSLPSSVQKILYLFSPKQKTFILHRPLKQVKPLYRL